MPGGAPAGPHGARGWRRVRGSHGWGMNHYEVWECAKRAWEKQQCGNQSGGLWTSADGTTTTDGACEARTSLHLPSQPGRGNVQHSPMRTGDFRLLAARVSPAGSPNGDCPPRH